LALVRDALVLLEPELAACHHRILVRSGKVEIPAVLIFELLYPSGDVILLVGMAGVLLAVCDDEDNDLIQ